MQRTARVIVEKGYYHINTRGNQKQKVFAGNEDYQKYLKLLEKYKRRYAFKLYAFCLMPNHVHLLIKVEEGSMLQKIMQGLSLSYTLYFNIKYEKVGHLWQDRFKSKVIQTDKYFLECIAYIEANPVRKNLAPTLEAYPWSSSSLRLKNNSILDDF